MLFVTRFTFFILFKWLKNQIDEPLQLRNLLVVKLMAINLLEQESVRIDSLIHSG